MRTNYLSPKRQHNKNHEYTHNYAYPYQQSPISSKEESTKQQLSTKHQQNCLSQAGSYTQIRNAFLKPKKEQTQKNKHWLSVDNLVKYEIDKPIRMKKTTKLQLKEDKHVDRLEQYYDTKNQKTYRHINKYLEKLSDSADSGKSQNSKNSVYSQGNMKFQSRGYFKMKQHNEKEDFQGLRHTHNRSPSNFQVRTNRLIYPKANTNRLEHNENKEGSKKLMTGLILLSPQKKQQRPKHQVLLNQNVLFQPNKKQFQYQNYTPIGDKQDTRRRGVTPHKNVARVLCSPVKQRVMPRYSRKPNKQIKQNNTQIRSKDSQLILSISISKDKSDYMQRSARNRIISPKNYNDDPLLRKSNSTRLLIQKQNILVLYSLGSQMRKTYEFLILETLAQHKLSSVFLCIQTKIKMVCCLKKFIVDKDNIQHLIIQHKLGFTCNHQNLVRTFACLHDGYNAYILMEYMEGGTLLNRQNSTAQKHKSPANLRQTLSRPRQITTINKLPNKKQILQQILEGINYLHKQEVVHRDVKPQNIFISHGTHKVGDFGSSSFIDLQEYVGTLDYAAPQIMLKQRYTKNIDIWSAGCIAYQMEVGNPPFYHIQRKQTIRRIVNVQYDKNLITDRDLRNLISQMLQREGDWRISATQALKHPYFQYNQHSMTRNRIW